ncbi:MAG: hypothetical protein ACYC7E_02015 [Armatimonadota bacterium]
MRFFAMLLTLLFVCPLFANDGFAGVAGEGGRMRLLDGEHPTIRMVKEWVRIDVHLDYYEVVAQFHFHNDGPATNVTMGFPESGGGSGDGAGEYQEYRLRSAYTNFTCTVDGKPVATKRTVKLAEEERYRALWIKTVPFARDQTRTIRVSYRSESGEADAVGEGHRYWVRYHFTGGNWKGALDQAELLIVSHIPGALVLETDLPDRKKITSTVAKDNRLAVTWKHWQAQADFTGAYVATYPEWLSLPRTVPNYLSQWDFLCPVKPTYTLVNPGTPSRLLWAPAVVRRNGIVYVKLDALVRYLDSLAEQAKQPVRAAVSTDDGTIMQVGAYRFRFRLRETTMQVNDRTVDLPARPFLSVPEAGGHGNRLYVPLGPTVQAMGGAVQVDEKKRLVKPTIPPFWGAEKDQ